LGSTIGNSRLRTIAAVSGVYDALVGIALLGARPLLAQVFGVPLPQPPIHADLNGLFLLGVACGYLIPYRDPGSRGGRTYLWTMNVWLKGAGATLFLLDHYLRQSPASYLVFAVGDGTLALITLWALLLE
jgi:hypothetical protein